MGKQWLSRYFNYYEMYITALLRKVPRMANTATIKQYIKMSKNNLLEVLRNSPKVLKITYFYT